MKIHKTYLGYWYQRTTLHLSEIYDFLIKAESPLWLNKHKLAELRQQMQIEKAELKTGSLEHIDMLAKNGISVKIFEDGLVIISNDHSEIKHDVKELTTYYERHFSPAISYIFSLGAPVPKELANIKTVYPYFILTSGAVKSDVDKLLKDVGESEYFEIKSGNIEIYRGDTYYVLNSSAPLEQLEDLVGMQIFFREFKSQLHHYLNLHRAIWEKIETVKNQRHIQGRHVGEQRALLESYSKTIDLIEGRINQMGVYIQTRSAMVAKNKWDSYLSDVLEFRYDNLQSSLDYIKSLWSMTKEFLDSAIDIFSGINELSTRNSVQALTIISSIGVVAGVIGFLSEDKLPQFTGNGFVYFALLLFATLVINQLLRFIYSHMKYKIADIKLAKISTRSKEL